MAGAVAFLLRGQYSLSTYSANVLPKVGRPPWVPFWRPALAFARPRPPARPPARPSVEKYADRAARAGSMSPDRPLWFSASAPSRVGAEAVVFVEAAGGFEPPSNGFADRRLNHLATPPFRELS